MSNFCYLHLKNFLKFNPRLKISRLEYNKDQITPVKLPNSNSIPLNFSKASFGFRMKIIQRWVRRNADAIKVLSEIFQLFKKLFELNYRTSKY